MTDNTLAIDEIRIESAPGFRGGTDGFRVDKFSPGINVIHGPNGVGKSTLARSLLGLLWQEKAANSELTGWFSLDGDDWRVDVGGSSPRYQIGGSETSAPDLPAKEHADRYELALHDLLQRDSEATNSFAETIQRESIGGYDLDAAYDELNFHNSPSSRRISEYDTAENARDALLTAEQEAGEIQRAERELPQLEAELEDARVAQERVEALNLALEYAKAQRELDETTERLAGYSDRLTEIDGNEADRAESLRGRIEEKRKEIDAADAKKADAQDRLDDAALPDEGVSEATIAELRKKKDRLETLESTRESIKQELEGLKKRRDEDRGDLPLDIETETLEAIEPAEWGSIQEFLEDVDEFNARQELRKAVLEWLGDEPEVDTDVSTLKRGQHELESWLAARDDSADSTDSVGYQMVWVSAGVLAATGVLGAAINPALLLLLVVSFAVFVYGYRQYHRDDPDDESDTRATSRAAFERLDLRAPSSWTPDAVQSRLIELYTAQGEAVIAEDRANKREELAPDADTLKQEQSEIQVQRDQFRSTYGVTPATDLELAVLAHGIHRWKRSHSKVVEQEGELEKSDAQIEDAKSTLESRLAPYGYRSVDSAATAHGYIRNLNDRRQEHEAARGDLDEAIESLQTAEDDLESLQDKRETIFTELELEPTDDDRLAALCEDVEPYREAQNAVERAEERVEEVRAELKQHAGSDPEMVEQPVSELEAAKEEAEETASDYDAINKKIAQIEERIDQAKRRSDVADARKNKERALDALRVKLEADAEAMVGHVLVQRLQEATNTTDRPEVFERAGELLQRITADQYKLEFDNGEFRAFDTTERKGLALDELSSGTQLQVLLAVRLAFVETKEHGAKLPLVLDETLANSDDTRATVIIESLIELARDGRQLFYFTAQADEVGKWKQALADTADVPFEIIDIGGITNHETQLEIPTDTFPAIERPSLPDPAGHDHESYGETLDVPPFSPQAGAGAAHIWYVVDDTELLYDLLSDGVETWGQLSELLKRTADEPITDDTALIETIRHNGRTLEKFVECWEIGRGEPVDRQALEATSAVTSTFIDRVSELADELNGDAEAILEALDNRRVSGFRKSKRDDLEEYFREEGYIEETETMEPALIRSRTVTHLTNNGLTQEAARTYVDSLLERLNLSQQHSQTAAEVAE